MLVLLTLYFGAWFALLGTATLLFWRHRPGPPAALPERPRVSILLAARNEEAAISRCLQAIRALDYPAALIEVLLGDDGSTDQTAAVAEAAMQGYAGRFQVLPITAPLGLARGKANVLAHLARAATTDLFLLTDADIAVPPTWVQGLLAPALSAENVGTVTGLTVVRGPRLFDQLQGLDWLLSLGLMQVVSDQGQPVTAMGNNMLVTRAAYEATGGYEALPFSVTEDFALFQTVLARGFTFRNVFSPEVLAFSLPIATPAALLQQRRRWLRGVEGLPGWLQSMLLFYGSFHLALIGLLWVAGPLPVLGVLAAKMLLQGLLAHLCFRRAGLRLRWALLPAFEIYTVVLTLSLGVFRLLARRFSWKGRQYE
jgi:1,2-diacylglycerol 3-beta-glucosyltransferase